MRLCVISTPSMFLLYKIRWIGDRCIRAVWSQHIGWRTDTSSILKSQEASQAALKHHSIRSSIWLHSDPTGLLPRQDSSNSHPTRTPILALCWHVYRVLIAESCYLYILVALSRDRNVPELHDSSNGGKQNLTIYQRIFYKMSDRKNIIWLPEKRPRIFISASREWNMDSWQQMKTSWSITAESQQELGAELYPGD